MKETINNIVNFSIGGVKSFDENVTELISQAQATLDELIAKGDAASDESSIKVKDLTQQAITKIKNLEEKVKSINLTKEETVTTQA